MTNASDRSARIGLITDQTGPLSFMGIANANVARMVIDDINAAGGLLGRPVELFIEDSATDDEVAEARAAKLVERDTRRGVEWVGWVGGVGTTPPPPERPTRAGGGGGEEPFSLSPEQYE